MARREGWQGTSYGSREGRKRSGGGLKQEITALTGSTGRGLPDEPVERGGVKGIRGGV